RHRLTDGNGRCHSAAVPSSTKGVAVAEKPSGAPGCRRAVSLKQRKDERQQEARRGTQRVVSQAKVCLGWPSLVAAPLAWHLVLPPRPSDTCCFIAVLSSPALSAGSSIKTFPAIGRMRA